MQSSPQKLKGKTRLRAIAEAAGDDRAAQYILPKGPLQWLLDLMADAGTVKTQYVGNSDGIRAINVPLSWTDIHHWVEGAGMQCIKPHWLREIMRLSVSFAATFNEAQNSFECPVPFQP